GLRRHHHRPVPAQEEIAHPEPPRPAGQIGLKAKREWEVFLPLKGPFGLHATGSGLRLGVVPSRGSLLGSVSHPWLTRRRSASMRCFPQPPARDDHRLVAIVASAPLAIETTRHEQQEPRPGGRGSRKAKHGCFARESGQDAPTEREATPGRQGAASVRSRTLGAYSLLHPAPGWKTQKKAPAGPGLGDRRIDEGDHGPAGMDPEASPKFLRLALAVVHDPEQTGRPSLRRSGLSGCALQHVALQMPPLL